MLDAYTGLYTGKGKQADGCTAIGSGCAGTTAEAGGAGRLPPASGCGTAAKAGGTLAEAGGAGGLKPKSGRAGTVAEAGGAGGLKPKSGRAGTVAKAGGAGGLSPTSGCGTVVEGGGAVSEAGGAGGLSPKSGCAGTVAEAGGAGGLKPKSGRAGTVAKAGGAGGLSPTRGCGTVAEAGGAGRLSPASGCGITAEVGASPRPRARGGDVNPVPRSASSSSAGFERRDGGRETSAHSSPADAPSEGRPRGEPGATCNGAWTNGRAVTRGGHGKGRSTPAGQPSEETRPDALVELFGDSRSPVEEGAAFTFHSCANSPHDDAP